MRWSLSDTLFAGATGRGVIVAVIDSGVHAGHPHIGNVMGGVSIAADGEGVDFVDRLGHGTAVAAAIHEKAPDASLLAVRVFDRTLATSADILARAIEWSADRGARLINLSLGTPNAERTERLAAAVAYAAQCGAVVVSARETDDVRWYPGALAGVLGVVHDPDCARDSIVVRPGGDGLTIAASPYPRPIPGVPIERNLSGVSFAVANVSGMIARTLERETGVRNVAQLAVLFATDERAR